MQKGKGSTASPPAGPNRGQQSSQRGPTPPQSRQDDYNQRNAQSFQQNINVQPVQMFPGMVHQGQPQRMQMMRNFSRPMRMAHHSQQSNQPMYPSPTGVGPSMLQMTSTGPPNHYGIPPHPPFVQQQMEYQPVQVGNQQIQYRPAMQSTGYNQQMNFTPAYTPSMSQPPMPFNMPPQQGLMFPVRNQQMQQNIGGQYQVPRQEQPAPRKRNIIKIRDPNQDNKDITDEILASASHSIPASESNASGHSSSSNTPPVNSNATQNSNTNDDSVKKQFEAQVAARLHEDSKPKTTTSPTTTPIQTTKSTSPKHIQTKTMSTVKVISIEKNNSRTVKKEEPKPEVQATKPQVKPTETPASEEAATKVVPNAIETEVPTTELPAANTSVEKPKSEVDGANISTESKKKVENELEKKDTILESKPLESEKTEISKSSELVSIADPVSDKNMTKAAESELSIPPKETTLPNGSISPSEELTKPKEIKESEIVPPVDEFIKSDQKTIEESETKNNAEPEVVACTFENVESSEQPLIESSVNGIESDPKSKPAVPATEPVKRKKTNKRFKDFDKKPESDLMDAYREAPVKQDIKEEVATRLLKK